MTDSGARQRDEDAHQIERPVIQDCHLENRVEIVFPNSRETVVISDKIAEAMCNDMRRITEGRHDD